MMWDSDTNETEKVIKMTSLHNHLGKIHTEKESHPGVDKFKINWLAHWAGEYLNVL